MIIRPNGNTGRLPSARLPSEYQEVEYIESSGTQYIDTGFMPNQDSAIKIKTNITTVGSGGFLYGARNSGSVAQFGCYLNNASKIEPRYGSSNMTQTSVSTLTDYEFYQNKTSFFVNSTEQTWTAQTFTTNYNLCLFAMNTGGTVSSYTSIKLYSCKIWDNDTLIRNFVPCYRISDNEIGLYDLVNGVFYDNDGTGTFTKGNDVSLTDLYTEVEYIESTGTQYIDTDFKPNQDTSIKLDMAITEFGDHVFYGARHTGNSNSYVFFQFPSSLYLRFGYDYGTPVTSDYNRVILPANTFALNQRFLFFKDKEKTYIDGVQKTSNNVQDFTCDYNLVLMARNTGGTVATFAKMKLYSCKLYDNSVLIRDFIPCYRNSDNEVGLYDIVNNIFYTNAGTGLFTAGEIIKTYDILVPKLGDINISKVYLGSALVYQKIN